MSKPSGAGVLPLMVDSRKYDEPRIAGHGLHVLRDDVVVVVKDAVPVAEAVLVRVLMQVDGI